MITPLVVQLALVEAQLGDMAARGARIEGYIAELGERGGPTTRGSLHEARAADGAAGRRHDDSARAPRAHGALVPADQEPGADRALRAAAPRARGRDCDAPRTPASSDTRGLGLPAASWCGARWALPSSQQRFARALELLLAHAGGEARLLLRYDTGGLHQLAPRPGEPLSSERSLPPARRDRTRGSRGRRGHGGDADRRDTQPSRAPPLQARGRCTS